MIREDAVTRLEELVGQDLRPLADVYNVTVWRGSRKNKGWAGHVLKRHLGLPLNSSRSPNFGSWELKLIPLRRLRSGVLTVKETMAITMIDPDNVQSTPFEASHLLTKLRRAVVCARIFESTRDDSSILHRVSVFDLDDQELYLQLKSDYDLVRDTIRLHGFSALTGRMGVFIQPRTKGPGHGSVSRAFYARTKLVARMIGLQ